MCPVLSLRLPGLHSPGAACPHSPSAVVGSPPALNGLQKLQPFCAHVTLAGRRKGTVSCPVLLSAKETFSRESSSKVPAPLTGQNQVCTIQSTAMILTSFGQQGFARGLGITSSSINTWLRGGESQEGKGRLLIRQRQQVQNTHVFLFYWLSHNMIETPPFMHTHTAIPKTVKAVINKSKPKKPYQSYTFMSRNRDQIFSNSICLLYQPDGKLLKNYVRLFKHQTKMQLQFLLCFAYRSKKFRVNLNKTKILIFTLIQ